MPINFDVYFPENCTFKTDNDTSCSCSTNDMGDAVMLHIRLVSEQSTLVVQLTAIRGSWRSFAITHQRSNARTQTHAVLSHADWALMICRQ